MPNDTKTITRQKFQERFAAAVEGHPRCPVKSHGRLKWFRDLLESEAGINVSLQTVQKWASGGAVPRPDKTTRIAQVLGVDAGWLAMGRHQKTEDVVQEQARAATGATMLLAGIAEMRGAQVAFPEADDDSTIFITMNRRMWKVTAVPADGGPSKPRFMVPLGSTDKVIGVAVSGLNTRLFDLTNAERNSRNEVAVEDLNELTELKSFEDIFV